MYLRSRQTVTPMRDQMAAFHTTTDCVVVDTQVTGEEYATFKGLMVAEGLILSDSIRRLTRLAVGAADLRVRRSRLWRAIHTTRPRTQMLRHNVFLEVPLQK